MRFWVQNFGFNAYGFGVAGLGLRIQFVFEVLGLEFWT